MSAGISTETLPPIDFERFKVVVSKDLPFYDNGPIGTTWILHKLANEDWERCSRDNPNDSAAFEHLKQVSWLAYPVGEYTLAGMELAPQHSDEL